MASTANTAVHRYEIHLRSQLEEWFEFGRQNSDQYWHALVWDVVTGDEVEEFSGWNRQEVLRQAAAKRAEMERKLTAGGPDITPEQAMRFSRVFIDLITSVNKSIDGFEIHYGYGISEGLEVRVYPPSDPSDRGARLSRPIAVSVGPGQELTDVLESTLRLARQGK